MDAKRVRGIRGAGVGARLSGGTKGNWVRKWRGKWEWRQGVSRGARGVGVKE